MIARLYTIKIWIKALMLWHKYRVYCRKEMCLYNGYYQMYYSQRRFYIINTKTNDECLSFFDYEKGYKVGLTHHLNCYKGGNPVGNIAMITTNGFKVFNIENDEVYSLSLDRKEIAQLTKSVELLSPFFRLTYKSIKSNYCTEIIAKGKLRKKWNKDEIIDRYFLLCESYVDYFTSQSVHNKSLHRIDYTILDIKKIPIAVVSILKELEGIAGASQYEFIFQHGDLHFGNTFFDDSGFWLLDLEDARDEVFFYDLFNPIFVEFTDWHNSSLLDMYLNNDIKLISYFKRAFTCFGCTFDDLKLKQYFIVFLYARLVFQIKKKQSQNKGSRLIKKIEASARNVQQVLEYIRKE